MLGYAYTRTRTDKTAYQMDFMSSYEGILGPILSRLFQVRKYFRTCTTLFNTFEGTCTFVPSKIDTITSVLDTVQYVYTYCTLRKYLVLSYESTSVRTRTTMIND